MKTHASAKRGFTLVEIMIVVAVIGLLGAIAVPNLVQARTTSQTNACINNLREIDNAKQQWALENGKNSGDTPQPSEIQPYLGRGIQGSMSNVYCPLSLPPTPLGGYTVNSVGTPPVCNQYDATLHPALLD
jgi:prepilin-type N-terminal cleavage/methylation domain-containing protein